MSSSRIHEPLTSPGKEAGVGLAGMGVAAADGDPDGVGVASELDGLRSSDGDTDGGVAVHPPKAMRPMRRNADGSDAMDADFEANVLPRDRRGRR